MTIDIPEYKIIFSELDRLGKETNSKLTDGELEEYEEIRKLREIVLKIQTPERTYLTST